MCPKQQISLQKLETSKNRSFGLHFAKTMKDIRTGLKDKVAFVDLTIDVQLSVKSVKLLLMHFSSTCLIFHEHHILHIDKLQAEKNCIDHHIHTQNKTKEK